MWGEVGESGDNSNAIPEINNADDMESCVVNNARSNDHGSCDESANRKCSGFCQLIMGDIARSVNDPMMKQVIKNKHCVILRDGHFW